MNGDDDLLEGATEAELHAPRSAALPCANRPDVSPVIAVAAPKVVLVKKAYQTAPRRLVVRLSSDVKFAGSGTLSSSTAGDFHIVDGKGVRQALPLTIPAAKLSKGLTLYIEGAAPSANHGASRLSLALTSSDKNVKHSPATDSFTVVELNLELGAYKAAAGGPAPAPVADKIGGGRNLHLQTADLWAGRAWLKMRKPLPADYTGDVVLRSLDGRVRAFPDTQEVPNVGDAAVANPLSTACAAVPGGGRGFWIEGASASKKVLDTGYVLEVSDLPGVEGDRAMVTVVEATVVVHDVPTKPGAKPTALSAAAKMDPGRPLQLQNGGNTMGLAKVVVNRVKPKAWVGDLELVVWDVTAGSAANPRVRLKTDTSPPGAHANPLPHNGGYPSGGRTLWAEGATVSGDLRDTQLRLRVADAEGNADHAAFTVHEFYAKEVFFDPVVPLYYARIPTAGSYLLTPPADAPATHLSPAEVRPAAGTPHWKRQAGQNPAAEFSWPAVYGRKKADGVPAPTLRASFELFPKVPGVVAARIHADGGASGVGTDTQDVTFTDGDSPVVTFSLERLPNTVARRDGMELTWHNEGPAHKTQHTLFFVDKMPRAANNLGVDEHLWEIAEWSCQWVDGQKGRSSVFNAIWARFNPVAAAHATGLVYWKNHHIGVPPNQDLASAIQSQDAPTPMNARNAASCIVFDRVLINCLAMHGIASSEIKLTPSTPTFVRGGVTYQCIAWKDTTVVGQGNPAAPPFWESHWIADVKLGSWKFYDASYGAGPAKATEPGAAGSALDVFSFEPLTVHSFLCDDVGSATRLLLARDPKRSHPPRLDGLVLWENK